MPIKSTFGHRIIRSKATLAKNGLPVNLTDTSSFNSFKKKYEVAFIITWHTKFAFVLFILEVDYLVSIIDNFIVVYVLHLPSFFH
jgi:hypothetical protein